jgi:hypothetical protein
MQPDAVSIMLEGDEANEQSLRALQDWLRRERLPGLQVERPAAPPPEGAMGVTLTAILSVVLGSASVVQLAKSVHTWMTARRPKLKAVIVVGKKRVELVGENVQDWNSLLEHIKSVLEALEQSK